MFIHVLPPKKASLKSYSNRDVPTRHTDNGPGTVAEVTRTA